MKKTIKLGTFLIGIGAVAASTISCQNIWTQDESVQKKNDTNSKPTKPNPEIPIPVASVWTPTPTETYWKGEDYSNGGNILDRTNQTFLFAEYSKISWFLEQTKNLNAGYSVSMPQKANLRNGTQYDITYTADPGYKFDDGSTNFTKKWIAGSLKKKINKIDIINNLNDGKTHGKDKTINGEAYHSIDLQSVPPAPTGNSYIEIWDGDATNDDVIVDNGILWYKVYTKSPANPAKHAYKIFMKPKKDFYFDVNSISCADYNYISGGFEWVI